MIDVIDKNKSYTNKDFQSIYDEMLELVPKLTSKWTPSESDESDPGVVLIKLMAALGDKLNYNIDKQVLEMFPGTVSQRKNARQLYNLIGYKMKWYRSSIVDVSFKLKSGIPNDELPTDNIIIPKFTQLTDTKNQVSFVTLSDVEIDITDSEALYTIQAMEGVKNSLTVNNSADIRISDLDENNRIYFDATRIAENGIFISDSLSGGIYDWKQVDNIEAQPLGNKVFEFNLSADESVAYIQFPFDMNSLIGQFDKVNIDYITTNGLNGNINSGILEKFSQSITVEDIPLESLVRIIQNLPSQFGTDPETIDDAYRNSRLIIGTFNTLITRQDYQNYIRRLMEDNKPLVSNAVVADRTNDINYTNKVVVLEDFRERIVTGAKLSETDYLTAYDIVLYLLEPSTNYEESFKPIEDDSIKYKVEELVEEVKAVNQDLLLPSSSSDNIMYLFRNKYKLKGQIVTVEKLTKDEALALELKIKEALQQRYSAYNVEFGQIIDYPSLIEFIASVDSRIKTVALDSPIYQVSLTEKEGTSPIDQDVTLDDDRKQELVARMITAGNVQLFEFDSNFNKDFGQTLEENITEDITSISTETTVELASTDVDPFTLRTNEVLYALAPLYNVTKQYSVGVKAIYKNAVSPKIVANIDYVLQAGEYVKLNYTDVNGQPKEEIISTGIIRTTVDLMPDVERILTANYTLSVKEKSEATLIKNTEYIIILNSNRYTESNKNYFKLDASSSIILDTDEYLFYTDSTRSELVMLGSGVELKNNSPVNIKQELTDIPLSDINTSDIKNISWYKLLTPLNTIEYEIIAIGEGNSIRLVDVAGSISIDNTYKYLTSDGTISGTPLKLKYITSEGESTLSVDPNGEPYKVRTRFNLVYTGDPIIVYDGQEVALTTGSATYTVEGTTTGVKLQFSLPVLMSGSNYIEIPSDTSLTAYVYTEDEEYAYKRIDEFITIEKTLHGNMVELDFDFVDIENAVGGVFDTDGKGTLYLVPISIKSASETPVESIETFDTTLGVPAYVDVLPMTEFSVDSGEFTYENGTYILYIKPGMEKLKFNLDSTVGGPNISVNVGRIKIVKGINVKEINTSFAELVDTQHPDYFALQLVHSTSPLKLSVFELIEYYNELVTPLTFNYLYEVPETNKVLFPTISENYFNINHIANKYTIPCFDISKYSIKVNQFSIK